MENKEYLNEQKYQAAEKSITLGAILVLVIGLLIGGFLIYKGVSKPGTDKVDTLKVQLENKKRELESEGVKFDESAEYQDGKTYDLKIITEALDPSFPHCNFDEYKNNSLTKEYCAAKNSTDDFSSGVFIMIGIFICVVTVMISGSILIFAKRRHILAFGMQQTMPLAKEGIEKMAPTVGNAAGEIAKGITSGIKSGLNSESDK